MAGCVAVPKRNLSPHQTAAALEARSLADPGLRQVLEAAEGTAIAGWPLKLWSRERLLLCALYFNPAFDVERARVASAEGSLQTASERPNPTLNLGPEYSTNPPPGVSPWLPSIGLDWTIETAGKRARRREQASFQIESAKLGLSNAAWNIRRDLTQALVESAAAADRDRLSARRVELLEDLVQRTNAQVVAGAAAPIEYGAIQARRTAAQLDRNMARAELVASRSRVAAILGIPVSALADVDLQADLPSDRAAALMTKESRRTALELRADVRAALADYDAAHAALRIAVARQYPDIQLGPGYQWDQGQSLWRIGLGVILPVLNRNRGPIAEALAHREEAARRFVNVQADVVHDLDASESALRSAGSARQSAERSLEIAVDQQRRAAALQRAGAIDQLEFVTAELAVVDAEFLLSSARRDEQRALAALEDAVREPLDDAGSLWRQRAWPVGAGVSGP